MEDSQIPLDEKLSTVTTEKTKIEISKMCSVCKSNNSANKLVKPCTNDSCYARVHEECIVNWTKQGYVVCNVCHQRLAMYEYTTFNFKDCCGMFVRFFTTFLIMLCSPASLFFLLEGKTINCMIQHACPDIENTLAYFFGISLIIGSSISYGSLFFCCTIPYECDCFFDKVKYDEDKHYKAALIICGLWHLLLLLFHLFGIPVIKFIFNDTDYFTIKTSIAGLVVCAIITALIALGSLIFCLYFYLKKRFSETKIIVGNSNI